jgi:hypothetical protein
MMIDVPTNEPYIISAETRGAFLYRLRDSRFQIVRPGKFGPDR